MERFFGKNKQVVKNADTPSPKKPRSSSPKIWLRSLNPNTHRNFEIPRIGKSFLGRSDQTQIDDIYCSKTQLLVEADKTSNVRIKVNGANASGFNGLMMERGTEVKAKHGDVIELLYGRYPYRIEMKNLDIEKNSTNNETSGDMETANNCDDEKWNLIDDKKLILFNSGEIKGSDRIAGYDLDWTIIKPKSGNVFPKDINDWEIMWPDIPGKLKSYHNSGYKICIFTNQSAIGKGKIPLEDFKLKINSIMNKLKIPMQVFISTSESKYRKPVTAMWDYLENEANDGIKIDKSKSFYVGDAAGRPEMKLPIKRKKDHSCVDRLFALNIGVTFFTPEEHFLCKKPIDWIKPDFDPKEFCQNKMKLIEPEETKIPAHPCEVILMVGLPGSGKSFFCQQNLKSLGYEIISADILGSIPTCAVKLEKYLDLRKSCVIDNTNVDISSRKKFLDICTKYRIPCRCFVLQSTIGQIKHNLMYRTLIDKNHSKINDMILNKFKKRYLEPTKNEGFKDIIKINPIIKFENDEDEKLYKMFLLGK